MASFSRSLAVDLGATAVRLVEVGPDSKGRPTVLALSEEEIPYDPGKTSDLFPLYAQALTTALSRLPSRTRQAHLCLGGPAVFARLLKIPAADPGKVRAVIGFEAQQTVPAIEQALWDYQLLSSPQPGEVEALILAIKKETVEEISAAASSAGLKILSATLVPAALLNGFFFNYPEATGCHLILEIGARATTILLVEDKRVFVRVIPLGGGGITQAVATDLQESFAGAEVLKRAKGFVHPGGAYEDPADAAAARISKLARGVMTRLHTEVERSITFFRSQQGGAKPTQAWLTGGGALLGYTDLFFREKLRIPVDWFQPFRRWSLSSGVSPSLATRDFPCWAAAVGTACQSLPERPVRIDLFSAVHRAQAQTERDLPAVIAGAFVGAILLLLPGFHGWWQAAKAGSLLESEGARVEAASRELQNLEQANQKFQVTTRQIELALALQRERLRWPGLLDELRISTPKKLWITTLRILPAAETPPKVGGKDPAVAVPNQVVEIAGMFETQSEKADAEAVANFQKALEKGGVLHHVTVLERETPRYVDGKTDQVALKFRLKAEWPTSSAATPPTSPGGS